MANRTMKDSKVLEAGVVKLFGFMMLGASGAITSQLCKGFSLVKTDSEVGRYTVALEDKYNALLSVSTTFEGPADAAYGAGGAVAIVRGTAVDATPPLLYVQVVSAVASPVDVEAPAGTKIYFEITLKNSSAY